MKNLLKNFFIKNNINSRNQKFVLGVSTGVDSMALLNAFLELREEDGFEIIVVHINHDKRKESYAEEEYIKSFTKEHDIKCYVKKLDYPEKIDNFQQVARNLRYEYFTEVIKQENAKYLVLAHHANDNMETILMRIIRGSNLLGYSGMNEKTDTCDYTLLRPFLSVLKEELIEYSNIHKIKYYEDSTNSKDLYTRNRIRKEIIPKLFDEDKNVHLKFNDFACNLKEASRIIDGIIDEYINNYVEVSKDIKFDIKSFLQLDNYIQIEVLFKLLKKHTLSKNNVLEIIKMINSDKANIKSVIKNKFTFVKEYNSICFIDKILEKQDFHLKINKIGKYYLNDNILINVMKNFSNIVTKDSDLWYNSNMLPVVVRSRQPGDKIKLESGYKKVKDLLIDEKIGILDRDRVLILEDKDYNILAVVGVKKSVILKQITNADIIIKLEEIY